MNGHMMAAASLMSVASEIYRLHKDKIVGAIMDQPNLDDLAKSGGSVVGELALVPNRNQYKRIATRDEMNPS
jgi:hypothetical protein